MAKELSKWNLLAVRPDAADQKTKLLSAESVDKEYERSVQTLIANIADRMSQLEPSAPNLKASSCFDAMRYGSLAALPDFFHVLQLHCSTTGFQWTYGFQAAFELFSGRVIAAMTRIAPKFANSSSVIEYERVAQKQDELQNTSWSEDDEDAYDEDVAATPEYRATKAFESLLHNFRYVVQDWHDLILPYMRYLQMAIATGFLVLSDAQLLQMETAEPAMPPEFVFDFMPDVPGWNWNQRIESKTWAQMTQPAQNTSGIFPNNIKLNDVLPGYLSSLGRILMSQCNKVLASAASPAPMSAAALSQDAAMAIKMDEKAGETKGPRALTTLEANYILEKGNAVLLWQLYTRLPSDLFDRSYDAPHKRSDTIIDMIVALLQERQESKDGLRKPDPKDDLLWNQVWQRTEFPGDEGQSRPLNQMPKWRNVSMWREYADLRQNFVRYHTQSRVQAQLMAATLFSSSNAQTNQQLTQLTSQFFGGNGATCGGTDLNGFRPLTWQNVALLMQ